MPERLTLPTVNPVSLKLDGRLQQAIDSKTKPLGALGRLERLALQLGRIQQTLQPRLVEPEMLVFAADHGIAAEGVSAYPPEVTWQMVMNFIEGGAAINVFCRQHGIRVRVTDVGVQHDFHGIPGLEHAKVAPGTANMLEGPAMTPEQAASAMQVGQRLVSRALNGGTNVFGFGEMGIGNTSSAALLMSLILELPVSDCVGRGTGLDDERLARKIKLLSSVAERHQGARGPGEILAAVGGFEIAAIAGGMLEAAAGGALVMVDGFIATAAFLVASRMQPALRDYAVFCHCSDEQGHRRMLQALDAEPLLELGMRLGEGTGCALAYPLLQSASAMLIEMASFSQAGVSEG